MIYKGIFVAGEHEYRPSKVLQYENQNKKIKADIGLGFLVNILVKVEVGMMNLWLCCGTERALQLNRSMVWLTAMEIIEHSPFALTNESAG